MDGNPNFIFKTRLSYMRAAPGGTGEPLNDYKHFLLPLHFFWHPVKSHIDNLMLNGMCGQF